MKRVFIGLFAAGVALGASTFTSLASKRHVLTYYYVLTEEGTYRLVSTAAPDPTNCLGTAFHKCFVGYATYQGLSFSSSSMPSTPVVQSASNGLYVIE